ncbi:MAG TPA: outer membrane beta-barrel protein [Chitinophagaceae bacterium]|nr:PorT family protein [Chitinophagaceae bacterium]HMZ45972.1 outer membrane beta-barrel protein [Chitinophagaceae bacterium]HNE92628.1 outer membrane beta-barrel protein [Chitinophagaceae bacterium]HNF28673.1 outer membrane beta-barrel protein [Chitinophagaceae bacterium]HNJ58804.1 outer membrane beta-barrel protein [Chitinophagaceae bacterium]
MYYLLRKQIILFGIFIFVITNVFAQKYVELNRPDRDELPYYFGMTLAVNQSYLAATKHTKFINDDSILSVQPGASSGISLGLLGTLKLNYCWEFRFNPQLIIGGSKHFIYQKNYPVEEVKKTLPSTIVSFPFQFKLNSDRLNNFRTYVLFGAKYDIDLASNSSARNAQDMVKLKKSDFALEAGIGFNFFLPFVTISPELKFSYGLSNIHSRDPALKYSNVFDKIQSRMISLSIHLED